MPHISFKIKLNTFKYHEYQGTNLLAVPSSIKNMQSASRYHPVLTAHFVTKLTAHYIFSQAVSKLPSPTWSLCHSLACRLIMNALSKAPLGACIISMDIGGNDRLAQQKLHMPENTVNSMVHKWPLLIEWYP